MKDYGKNGYKYSIKKNKQQISETTKTHKKMDTRLHKKDTAVKINVKLLNDPYSL